MIEEKQRPIVGSPVLIAPDTKYFAGKTGAVSALTQDIEGDRFYRVVIDGSLFEADFTLEQLTVLGGDRKPVK